MLVGGIIIIPIGHIDYTLQSQGGPQKPSVGDKGAGKIRTLIGDGFVPILFSAEMINGGILDGGWLEDLVVAVLGRG